MVMAMITKVTGVNERPGELKAGRAHDQSFQKFLWLLYGRDTSRDSVEAGSPLTGRRVGDLDWGDGHGARKNDDRI